MSQWIRLRLPSCRHGFESQAHYLRFKYYVSGTISKIVRYHHEDICTLFTLHFIVKNVKLRGKSRSFISKVIIVNHFRERERD